MTDKAITGKGEIVLSWNLNKFQAVDWYREKGLYCPNCKGEMFPRGGHGTSVRLHFTHKSSKCSSQLASHPEGDDHTAAKEWIYKKVKQEILSSSSSSDLTVDIEVPFPQCGKHGRKADVAVFYKGEPYCVFECQLSPLTQDALTQRIHDYREQGIESYWLLGKKAATDENIQCVTKYTQVVAFLEVESRNIDGSDFIKDVLN